MGFESYGGARHVACAPYPSIKVKREECLEFQASLGCMVNSRLAGVKFCLKKKVKVGGRV